MLFRRPISALVWSQPQLRNQPLDHLALVSAEVETLVSQVGTQSSYLVTQQPFAPRRNAQATHRAAQGYEHDE